VTTPHRRLVLLGPLALAACASLRDPAPGQFRIGGRFSVTLHRTWSDFTPDNARGYRLISINGPALDRLYLVAGLRADWDLSHRPLAFSGDRADLGGRIAALVVTLGYEAPVIMEMRAALFAGAEGARVAFTTTAGAGLAFAGVAFAAERDGLLDLGLFIAAREHYFAAVLRDAEATMVSATPI
jgi:hypothetical protein